MSSNLFITCFRADFDRFFGMLELQMERCPDGLWAEHVGGWPISQQFFHSLVCNEVYVFPDKEPDWHGHSKEIAMLDRDLDAPISRDAMRKLAATMKRAAHTYMDGLSAVALTEKHQTFSRLMGKDMNHLQALIAMIRHCNYHLGCIDTLFIERGIPLVYQAGQGK